MSLFWGQNEGGFGWSDAPQKKDTLALAINRINKRVGARPGVRITGNMRRKTFCTLGKDFFNFSEDELKKVTHHKSSESFLKYLDPEYVNVPQECFVSKVYQRYEQGTWAPPLSGNTSLVLADLTYKIDQMSGLLCNVCTPLLEQRLIRIQ